MIHDDMAWWTLLEISQVDGERGHIQGKRVWGYWYMRFVGFSWLGLGHGHK